MSLIKRTTSPNTLDSLRRDMDYLFDDLVPFSISRDDGGKTLRTWAPSTDITEDENEYLIRMDIPGMDKKDIKVNYQEGRVTISGERHTQEKEEKKDFVRQERYRGSFYRSFTLPEQVRDDDIKATFNQGVLTLKVPKAEAVKPKQIPVD